MPDRDKKFEAFLAALRCDADQAVSYFAFFKTTVDNPELYKKFQGSFAGYGSAIAISGAKNSLLLYCARAWDASPDAISIRNAFQNIPKISELTVRRQKQLAKSLDNEEVKSFSGRYTQLSADFEAARNQPYHPSIKVLRTEYFAHRIVRSSDRKKFESKGINIDDVTINNLVNLSEVTINLVGRIGYYWDGVVNPYPRRIEQRVRYCSEFWRLLPTFANVETL